MHIAQIISEEIKNFMKKWKIKYLVLNKLIE